MLERYKCTNSSYVSVSSFMIHVLYCEIMGHIISSILVLDHTHAIYHIAGKFGSE
jgi:hypothetical protein